jgi:two-component system CheB/CheR fusion protein
MILADYGPAAVVINADMEILHFRNDTGPYLSPAPGVASLNLLKMARQELLVELRAAVHRAAKQQEEVLKQGLHYRRDGAEAMLNLRVKPIFSATRQERYFLVLFEDAPLSAPHLLAAEQEGPLRTAKDERIGDLEKELNATREYMQSIIEEQEGTNEELKSANEEIQSTNEELQSTNEELETAKEELQSTNEELATVNEELENRNTDLGIANNDLTNLLVNVNLPILMLGIDMTIRQFTPQAEKLLNLIGSDLGRPISNIKPNLDIPDLENAVVEVVDRMTPRELEVMDEKGHWYSVRIRPYKTLDNRIDGVVVTFVEIDKIKDVERLKRMLKKEQRLATVVRDVNDAITMQDFNGKILAWNPAASRLYGYSESEALAMNVRDMLPKAKWPEHKRLMARLKAGELVEPFKTQRLCRDGREISVWLVASALLNEVGGAYAVATTERDLSIMNNKQ